jgi:hypothetical protein
MKIASELLANPTGFAPNLSELPGDQSRFTTRSVRLLSLIDLAHQLLWCLCSSNRALSIAALNTPFLILGFGRTFLGVGDHSDEARIARERFEVGVALHCERVKRGQTLGNGLVATATGHLNVSVGEPRYRRGRKHSKP